MSGKPGRPYARRCLVPLALKAVFTGLIPAGLAQELKLPLDARFETLSPAWIEVSDRKKDRRLLGHLAALAGPALSSRQMSWKHDDPHDRRCLIPQALRSVFTGVVPSQLAQDLKLPPGARFEALAPGWVEVGSLAEDRRLLDHLTAVAGPAFNSRLVSLTTPAFPAGVASSINFSRLPLHTRTRNCLEKEGLLSADLLQRQSFGKLLAILGFGVKCLLDLLTAVEGVNRTSEGNGAPAGPVSDQPKLSIISPTPPLSLSAPAFPAGVASSLNFSCLPLHTRTRNCLKKEGLLSADALRRLSVGELLAIPAFGEKCLIDLLTAVEATNSTTEGDTAPIESVSVLPELEVASLSLISGSPCRQAGEPPG